MGICWVRRFKNKVRQWEAFVIDVIYNRRRDKAAKRFAFFLRLLSFPFSWLVRLRLSAYKRRWLRSQHLGCMVIVVGNLTVGGTGKTPIVEKIARYLNQKKRRVVILSRGYKSKKESCWLRWFRWMMHTKVPPPKIVSDGKALLLNSEIAGDEPYLLAANLPSVPVVVDKDRVKAGQYAIHHMRADILLLDDGFQYLQLKGTHYILLVDATNPFGNGALLPRGILREPLLHMRRAQFICFTKVDQISEERLCALKRFVRRYNKKAPFLSCVHRAQYFQRIGNSERLKLQAFRQQKVVALSGIASPASFENFLTAEGANVVLKERFTDHYRYKHEDLQEIFERAKECGAQAVITTEKDAVRIDSTFDPILPFYFLRMEVECVDGDAVFHDMIDRITQF